MDKKELREIIKQEIKSVIAESGNLECQECGKKFRKANPTGNTKCPKCGSHDLELNEGLLTESLGNFLDRTLGNLDQVIISLYQEKHIDVKQFKMLQTYLIKVMKKLDVTLSQSDRKPPRGWKGSHLREIAERILKEKYAGDLGKDVTDAVKDLKMCINELVRLKYITRDEWSRHFFNYPKWFDLVFKKWLKGKGLTGY